MRRFHVSLWNTNPRHNLPGHIEHTYVEADGEMQAAALALAEFRSKGKVLDGAEKIAIGNSRGNEDEDEQTDRDPEGAEMIYVSSIVRWARDDRNVGFIEANGLQWLKGVGAE